MKTKSGFVDFAIGFRFISLFLCVWIAFSAILFVVRCGSRISDLYFESECQYVGWQKIVSGVLGNIMGISTFRMDEDRRIEVSVRARSIRACSPKMLAKAGKKAEIYWWQFGQCPSNIYIPEYKEYNKNGSHYGGDGWCYDCGQHVGGGYGEWHEYYVDDGHLHYEGVGDRPQPKIQYKTGEEPPASPPADAPKGGCCCLN